MTSKPTNPDDGNRVGYGRPPIETRFKKGQSGNPKGRPKSSTSKPAILTRVLGEKRRLDSQPRGARAWYSMLEPLVMALKQRAVSGHMAATKLFDEVSEKYGTTQSDGPPKHGFLIVPEKLSEEEWEALYSPKDEIPDDPDA
ncbi:MAG: hypothetical protein KJ587_18130 [Alphaproteobacteria bacterium]|nr:hypothetical protein [Alphaproteobacteria bacterium]